MITCDEADTPKILLRADAPICLSPPTFVRNGDTLWGITVSPKAAVLPIPAGALLAWTNNARLRLDRALGGFLNGHTILIQLTLNGRLAFIVAALIISVCHLMPLGALASIF